MSTGQKRVGTTYKIDTGSDSTLMQSKVFKILVPKSALSYCAPHTKKKISHFKTYSQISNIGMCTVGLRHKDKNAKCRFFVLPEDGSALLGMTDIKLLNIPKIMCEVIGDPNEGR